MKMNRLLASLNYLLIGDKFFLEGRWIRERSRVSVIHYNLLSSYSKRRHAFGFVMLSLREAFVS